jgi:5S rRNA maturation endonuclease (ribonuclease M5)
MNYLKSLEDLEKAIEELREENKKTPIIVEGVKDIEALRKLGIAGEIIRYNAGVSVANFCDVISRKYKSIILLIDWDRKGGFLFSTLKKNLENRVSCNVKYREVFAKNSMIRTIEGLPSWIKTLKMKVDSV